MKRKIKFTKRLIVPLLVILAVFVATLTVGVTLARYIRGAANANNNFTAVGSDNPTVNNDWSITVESKGYPVYVRVEVIVSWQKNGDVLYVKPKKDTDYEIECNSNDWKPIKGYDADKGYEKTYYYYVGSNADSLNGVVKSGGKTTAIIESFVDKDTSKDLPYDGYELNVEIIVQTVQAVGYTDDDTLTACEDAWGLPHGALTPNTDSNTEGGNGTTDEGSGDTSEGN